jgi:hypothetical protein
MFESKDACSPAREGVSTFINLKYHLGFKMNKKS